MSPCLSISAVLQRLYASPLSSARVGLVFVGLSTLVEGEAAMNERFGNVRATFVP